MTYRARLGAVVFIVLAVVSLPWLTTAAAAQEKPAAPGKAPEAVVAALAPPDPRVTDQDQQTFTLLLYRAQVQQEIVAVLQKEVDSTNAEVSRLLARLQKPEFDLTRDPQTGRLVYLKKPDSPKKEPPR